jgi:hypothetical protein
MGHCNVPDKWRGTGELSMWLKRQFVALANRSLSPERSAILDNIGVKVEAVQQITVEWERAFDTLLDLKIVFNERGIPFPWDTAVWHCVPDKHLWDLARWLELQVGFFSLFILFYFILVWYGYGVPDVLHGG